MRLRAGLFVPIAVVIASSWQAGAVPSSTSGKAVSVGAVWSKRSVPGVRDVWQLRCFADAVGAPAKTTQVVECSLTTDKGQTVSTTGAPRSGNHAEAATTGVTRPAGVRRVCVTGFVRFTDGPPLFAGGCSG